MLVDLAPNAEAVLAEREEGVRQRKALYAALDVLTECERRVFEARRLARKPLTLDQRAHELSISAERVRQIEVQAFARVQRAARNQCGAAKLESRIAKSQLVARRVTHATRRLEPSSAGPLL